MYPVLVFCIVTCGLCCTWNVFLVLDEEKEKEENGEEGTETENNNDAKSAVPVKAKGKLCKFCHSKV